jgi:hypothetical protein
MGRNFEYFSDTPEAKEFGAKNTKVPIVIKDTNKDINKNKLTVEPLL